MSVLAALSESLGALRRNPVIVTLSVAVALLQSPALFAQQFVGDGTVGSSAILTAVSLGTSVVSVLVVPLVFAGMIAMADEALDGRTSLGTFLRSGRANYLSVFAAYFLLLAVMVVVMIVFGIGGLIVALVAGVAAAGSSSGITFGTVAIVLFLVTFLVPFLALFFVQFFGHAIVLDDEGAGSSFGHSAGLVRRNLGAVAGYFLTVLVLNFASASVASVGSLANTPGAVDLLPELSTTEALALQAVGLLVTGVVSSVFWPFSVAVYRRIGGSESGDDGANETVVAA